MITYFSNDKNGELKQQQKSVNGAWISVESPTAAEVTELEKSYRVEKRFIADALDTTTVPRVERSGGLLYMFIRYPRSDSGGLSTEPILFVVGSRIFMTVSQHHVDAFDKSLALLNVDLDKNYAELGLMLFNAIGMSYENHIESIGRKIEAIRSKLRGQIIDDDDFVNFVVIEGALNEFLTIMRSTSVMLKSLEHFKSTAGIFSKYPELVARLLASNERSISNCELYEKSISSIRDAYSTLSSNRLNQTMKVLTVATLFVALPTSIFSMYGMNVSLPMQDTSWSFAVILVVSLVMPLAILIWAKRRRLL